jgi:hypothetical protein
MKFYTQGHLFDTTLAQHTFPLTKDGTVAGEVHCSQRGIWYVDINRKAEIKSPVEILNTYEAYLTPAQQDILIQASGLSWE